MCHFVWIIIMHGNLPANHTRFTHHISSYVSCYRCGATIQTILLTLRNCPKAMQVWNYLDIPSDIHFYEDEFIIWFKMNAVDDYRPIFLICCWMIWKSRSEESFTDNNHSLCYILIQINTLFHSTMKALGGSNNILIPRLIS